MGKISNFITCAAVEKKLRLQSDSVGPSCGWWGSWAAAPREGEEFTAGGLRRV